MQQKKSKQQTEEILHQYNLSLTKNRLDILDFFLSKNYAIEHSDIEKKFKNKIDRITIYRTLQVFSKKGIIHTIPTVGNNIKYALCKTHECSQEKHIDKHIHFECIKCNMMFCVENMVFPEIKNVGGYIIKEVQINAVGVCPKCNNK